MPQVSSVQFTVGKIDAGLAILLSPDNYVVEFPASILPDKVFAGSIVNITIERNKEEEIKQLEDFQALQLEIFQEFSRAPHSPVIESKRITQTSIIVQWNPIIIHSTTFRGIDIYRNGLKTNLKPSISAKQIKLTGLEVGTNYVIQMILRTSGGSFKSNLIKQETHSMDNLAGLHPCFGAFSNDVDIDELIDLLQRVGGSYSDDLSSDNTHLVCTIARGPKYDKAVELNIPIVTPEFLKSCESNSKVQPAHLYYIHKT